MVAAEPKDGRAPGRPVRLTGPGPPRSSRFLCCPTRKTIVKILPQPVSDSGPPEIGSQVRAGSGSDLGAREMVPGTSTQTTRLVWRVVTEQAGPEGVSRVLGNAGLRDQQVGTGPNPPTRATRRGGAAGDDRRGAEHHDHDAAAHQRREHTRGSPAGGVRPRHRQGRYQQRNMSCSRTPVNRATAVCSKRSTALFH
jgi:hypothetical protein